ncbi:MAG: hypothetical protein ACI8U4_001863, partial [Natronomonas sp.]
RRTHRVNEAATAMSRGVACASFLGHAEIEGSEPSPGIFSQTPRT